jgi:hypothetical protein
VAALIARLAFAAPAPAAIAKHLDPDEMELQSTRRGLEWQMALTLRRDGSCRLRYTTRSAYLACVVWEGVFSCDDPAAEGRTRVWMELLPIGVVALAFSDIDPRKLLGQAAPRTLELDFASPALDRSLPVTQMRTGLFHPLRNNQLVAEDGRSAGWDPDSDPAVLVRAAMPDRAPWDLPWRPPFEVCLCSLPVSSYCASRNLILRLLWCLKRPHAPLKQPNPFVLAVRRSVLLQSLPRAVDVIAEDGVRPAFVGRQEQWLVDGGKFETKDRLM